MTNDSAVATPPKMANPGSSRPAIRSVAGLRYGRSRSGSVKRMRITAAWAIVNDSIAPNAYMLPRKSACPGSSVTHATTPKIRIPIHGVPYFGCSRRRRSGSWRWMPIE